MIGLLSHKAVDWIVYCHPGQTSTYSESPPPDFSWITPWVWKVVWWLRLQWALDLITSDAKSQHLPVLDWDVRSAACSSQRSKMYWVFSQGPHQSRSFIIRRQNVQHCNHNEDNTRWDGVVGHFIFSIGPYYVCIGQQLWLLQHIELFFLQNGLPYSDIMSWHLYGMTLSQVINSVAIFSFAHIWLAALYNLLWQLSGMFVHSGVSVSLYIWH